MCKRNFSYIFHKIYKNNLAHTSHLVKLYVSDQDFMAVT